MTAAITSATQTDPTAVSATQSGPVAKPATSSQKSTQSQPPPTASTTTDTVNISSAAKAAVQEFMETQAQTAKEASGGDLQAQRLLAKEAAAKKAEG
jgi:hypothetical protein